MTGNNRLANFGGGRTLTDDELGGITGGAARTAPPSKAPARGLFEVADYSFDIEQVLNIA